MQHAGVVDATQLQTVTSLDRYVRYFVWQQEMLLRMYVGASLC